MIILKDRKRILWDSFKFSMNNFLVQLMTSNLMVFLIDFYTSDPKKIQSDLDEYSNSVKEYDSENQIHKSIIGLRLGIRLSSSKALSKEFSSDDFVNTLKEFNFSNLNLVNQLILLYTIFESLLGVVFDIISEMNPMVWKKIKINFNKKQIEHLLNTNKINDCYIEKYRYNMSTGKIKERFKLIKKELNFPLEKLTELINELDKFKAIRDIYIHNNGLVNEKLKELIKTDLEINEKFPLTNSYIRKISDTINTTFLIISALIAIKLEVTEDEYFEFIGGDKYNEFLESKLGRKVKLKFIK